MSKFDVQIVRDPEIFQQNRLPAHSDHAFYEKEDPRWGEESDCRMSLNGLWKFHCAVNAALAPEGFEKEETDCRAWEDIRVPGHIQLQGYDSPAYVNAQYPWDGREEIEPGQIPERFNPVASYVRYFTLPERFSGRSVILCFQGAESGLALWLNGHYVGYSEDSFTPSEFDLTPYLKAGENKLAAQVFKWTAGSWCEDQDFFRFSGLFREVYLYAPPKVHVRDLRLDAGLSEDLTRGEVAVRLELSAPARVKAVLLDGSRCAASAESMLRKTGELTLSVPEPRLWSAEKPNLYELRLEVRDEEGIYQETVLEKTGFRRIEIRDSCLLLNGKRMVFRGVNRHEFSALNGRAVSEADTWKDLVTMKRHNINAVRTSHYPNASFFYRMCDQLGLYVIDEANLETHGSWDPILRGQKDPSFAVPGDRPEFLELVKDRARSMVERDKNHPCVLIWSCGNESYGGRDIFEMSQLIRRLDPTRPVHYEGIFWDRRYPETSDIESTMYTPAAKVREYLAEHRDKPYILCEYSHAMGNSCGGLHKYTELAMEEPLFQGGFIWDYIDQSLTCRDRFGRAFQGYGGDFGERPTDYAFSGNGLVYARDREPSPKMQEVKACYQNIRVEFEGLTARIRNDCLFTDLSAFDCEAELAREGHPLLRRRLACACPPLSKVRLELPLEVPRETGEYTVTLSFRLKEDEEWADAGHEVAWGQTVIRREEGSGAKTVPEECRRAGTLPGDAWADRAGEDPETPWTAGTKALSAIPGGGLEVIHGWNNLGVRGDGFEVLFSSLHGGLVSYRWGGREMLKDMPRPNFWRAPVDNDLANLLPFRAGAWKAASLYATHKTQGGRGRTESIVEEEAGSVRVTFVYHLPVKPETDCQVSYRVFSDGQVEVSLSLGACAQVGQLPELSMLLTLDADYRHLSWYGLGPEETYPDRCRAKLGIYASEAAESMAGYLRPQECGSRMAVRRARLTDDYGRGLAFETGGLQLSALPYAPQMLENAAHPQELPLSVNTYVRIGLQQGIGGDDTWGAPVHPEYLLDNRRPLQIRFRFRGI